MSGPRAFQPVVMTVVAIVIAPFFAAIIIATWSGGRGGRSSAEPLETWSTWSVVDVVGTRRSRSRRGRRGPWSTWSELGGATRDMVDVVHGRCGRSLAEPLETWSPWSVVDVVGAQRSRLGRGRHGSLDGSACSTWLACGSTSPVSCLMAGTSRSQNELKTWCTACMWHADLLHTRIGCTRTPPLGMMKSSCMHA